MYELAWNVSGPHVGMGNLGTEGGVCSAELEMPMTGS